MTMDIFIYLRMKTPILPIISENRDMMKNR